MAPKVNPDQFRLFYGARELRDSLPTSGDLDYNYNTDQEETMPEMWSRKLDESQERHSTGLHGSGVFDSIQQEGVRPDTQLTVVHGERPGSGISYLNDGHHRVAAAAHLEETTGKAHWIPVEHRASGMQYRNYRVVPSSSPYRLPLTPLNASPTYRNTPKKPLNTGERRAVDSLVRNIFGEKT